MEVLFDGGAAVTSTLMVNTPKKHDICHSLNLSLKSMYCWPGSLKLHVCGVSEDVSEIRGGQNGKATAWLRPQFGYLLVILSMNRYQRSSEFAQPC